MSECPAPESEAQEGEFNPRTPFSVADRVSYAPGSIVSTTIVETDDGDVSLFAFDRGQRLSTHTAPFEALVHVIDGQAQITVGQVVHVVSAGEMILMPANVPHAVEAVTRFKMILTLLRP